MRIYKSKIAWGLFIPLYVYLIGIAIFMAFHQLYLLIAVFVLLIIYLTDMLLHTEYRIDGAALYISCGLFYRKTIAIEQIIQVKDTQNILSSPALSIKNRIEIRYHKYDTIIISPADKAAFIAHLQQMHPGIKIIAAAAKASTF
jgi:hypothetical protein